MKNLNPAEIASLPLYSPDSNKFTDRRLRDRKRKRERLNTRPKRKKKIDRTAVEFSVVHENSLFRIFSRHRSRRKIFDEQSVATTTAGPIAQAGGEFIEYNFPRSLFDRAYARARRYKSRVYVRPLDITNAWEPRGWSPTHAPGQLLRLNIYPSRADDANDDRRRISGLRKKQGTYTCFKNWSRSSYATR